MGLIKTEIFSKEQNDLAEMAKALGHPARIAILEQLFASNTCVCGELVNELGLAQPTISQHLKALKSIGLIKGTIEGTRMCYCIDTENWTKMKNALHTFLNLTPTNSTNCC